MKFLLDANISWRIVETLKLHFSDCFHIENVGLPSPAKDIEIWNFALTNNLIIVTNDEDFLNFINFKEVPPKVVLLRTGNQRKDYILNFNKTFAGY